MKFWIEWQLKCRNSCKATGKTNDTGRPDIVSGRT